MWPERTRSLLNGHNRGSEDVVLCKLQELRKLYITVVVSIKIEIYIKPQAIKD